MSEKQAFRVKPTSRVDRFTKLKMLKCFNEVHEMIISGWPVQDVAEFIQDKKGEYVDVKRDTLCTTLEGYRKSLPETVQIAKTIPKAVRQAAERVRKGLDELSEMEKLYDLQMRRIDIDFKTEQSMGKLMPTMTAEIKTAKDILQGMAQLKMDLGLDERHLGKIDLENGQVSQEVLGRYGKASVTKVLNSVDSRRKLLSLVERFAQIQHKRDELTDEDAGDENGDSELESNQEGSFDFVEEGAEVEP